MKTFWRWAGTIFFALAAIFLTLTGIGTSLPIDHSETCAEHVPASRTAVFDAVVDDAGSTAWRPDIAKVRLVSGSGTNAVWRETDTHGNTATYATAPFGSRGVRRSIPFVPGMAFGGAWTYEFESEGPHDTLVRITEAGEIYNPFFRFVARYVLGYAATMKTYLTGLGAHFGEENAIVCSSASSPYEQISTSAR